MDPSEVRQRILDEHAALRDSLVALRSALDAADDGDVEQLDEARERTARLCSMLARHTELEDRILAPALREADSWGEVRAKSLLEHHVQQRDELDRLAREANTLEPGEFSRASRALIEDILQDMRYEEREIVTDRILRDDVIGIDVEGG